MSILAGVPSSCTVMSLLNDTVLRPATTSERRLILFIVVGSQRWFARNGYTVSYSNVSYHHNPMTLGLCELGRLAFRG